MKRVDPRHAEELDKLGYTIVPGLLSEEELAECQQEASDYFPSEEEIYLHPDRYEGLGRVRSFPFAGRALNMVTTNPTLLDFMEEACGTTDLRLGESALQVKYGTRVETGADQTLHVDSWGKKSLAYPRDDKPFRQMFLIIYYSQVTWESAPTYVVPRTAFTEESLLTADGGTVRTPEDHPVTYREEFPILAGPGSALVFTGTTLHRGSAMRAQVGQRLAHFVTYHAAEATWMQSVAWPSGDRPQPDSVDLRRFIENSLPRQRQVIGFPSIDDPYWNEETLRGMGARYPGMDLSPYRRAVEERPT
ncbi:phytanoyl-CoA dioxygenase family protein [Streptomyces tendae]|uniref:phytanoyl-CoA dioxygenase family protein n=1 Tax=Streptomyces tendae TaxID=1932 RepID=UPI0033C5867B